jgi:hypothetical protein
MQLMFNPGTDDHWASRRNPLLTRPMSLAVRRTGDGLPYLTPEAQLLMKAKGQRPKDEADFELVAPALSDEQRTWLREAIERVHPGHPWLEALSNSSP